MKREICVLGTGRMGSSIVRTLLNHGYSTNVWNRTRAKCEPLIAAGAKSSLNLQDVIEPTDIIFVNVLDYAASDTLLKRDGIPSLLAGKTVVQLTSGSPRLAREDATWVGAQGADYLDGAIMATPDFIGRPDAALLYSGGPGPPMKPMSLYS
ncbi:NAD(P)-dependent oxidoreductase [Paramesorhizobium deserti]|uniref:NAD(P)-dependent oxidoreductase n=1 Tax=Paramesorhizobium deserti TaxID=1494590 RepID=UPI000A789B01|nr:NAD(P)-binding domain-containing protein [Paramesorhizobium deserti]